MAEDAVSKNETTSESRPAPSGDRRPAGDGDRRPAAAGDRRPPRRPRVVRRRKFCKFCADTSLKIDHKDPEMLRHFITERSKILPSRVTGTCAAHQRQITTAVKRARVLALLAFTPLHND